MTPAAALLVGMLATGALLCFVLALVPGAPRLDAALQHLSADSAPAERPADLGPLTTRSERLGARLYRVSPVRLTNRQRQALDLQDKTIAEFYADKVVMAVIGAVLPGLLGFLLWYAAGVTSSLPAVAALAGLVVGFFIPDVLLRRARSTARGGAAEALLTYMDLVTLERLANASATQALQRAAELSEAPLFVQVRTALERARLEQQPPYGELRRLATRLELSELADLADVMQLDETGAALSGTLRARVRELRDAHLTREQMAASAAAEGMTVYMTLPALIFGLIFLVAAMLKIVYS
jgi:tight adherence protein C